MWVATNAGRLVNLDHVAWIERVSAGWAMYAANGTTQLGVTSANLDRIIEAKDGIVSNKTR